MSKNVKEDDFTLIIKKEGERIKMDMEGRYKDMIAGFAYLMDENLDFRLLIHSASLFYMEYKKKKEAWK